MPLVQKVSEPSKESLLATAPVAMMTARAVTVRLRVTIWKGEEVVFTESTVSEST